MAGTLTAIRSVRSLYTHRPDQLLVFAGRFRDGRNSVEVPCARIRFVFEHELDLIHVPVCPSGAGWKGGFLGGAGSGDKAKIATREHLEDRTDHRRLFLVDDERARCRRSLIGTTLHHWGIRTPESHVCPQ